jgi:hypothetical protein
MPGQAGDGAQVGEGPRQVAADELAVSYLDRVGRAGGQGPQECAQPHREARRPAEPLRWLRRELEHDRPEVRTEDAIAGRHELRGDGSGSRKRGFVSPACAP